MSLGLFTKARTAVALGLRNIARVASYRMRLRAGIHPVQRIPALDPPRGRFFSAPAPGLARSKPLVRAEGGRYFGWFEAPDDRPPDWHRNPFTGARASAPGAPWWTLPDFDPEVGDVKAIWEPSRLDWVLHFAQRGAIDRLNAWLESWSEGNQPYCGHNWKCAQEASIRVMHLAVGALVLEQTASPEPALVRLLTIHLERIAPTVAYAMAQDNNHGTSEAAALLIGGSWLERLGVVGGAEWHGAGRRWLADRAARLIAEDGSFSQHSINYHRLMLDTLSLAEVWRRHLGLARFDDIVYTRGGAAAEWLRAMTDPVSGDAPNIGANDGANLLPLTDAGYRDYRPAVELATTVFLGRSAYPGPGPWRDQVRWLGVEPAAVPSPPLRSQLFDGGGYAVLRTGAATAVLRYPRFRFRPGHADALHLDLWVAGANLLRDGGSYGYNAGAEAQDYFSGAAGHNTIQLDDHEQMPRLGRFLWGDWLTTNHLEPIREVDGTVTVAAGYDDRFGARHTRRVELGARALRVEDAVGGIVRHAVLRWRLRPGSWAVDGLTLTDGVHQLRVAADVPIVRIALTTGWESRLYLQRTGLPVLEVEIARPGTIVSEYRWRP